MLLKMSSPLFLHVIVHGMRHNKGDLHISFPIVFLISSLRNYIFIKYVYKYFNYLNSWCLYYKVNFLLIHFPDQSIVWCDETIIY